LKGNVVIGDFGISTQINDKKLNI